MRVGSAVAVGPEQAEILDWVRQRQAEITTQDLDRAPTERHCNGEEVRQDRQLVRHDHPEETNAQRIRLPGSGVHRGAPGRCPIVGKLVVPGELVANGVRAGSEKKDSVATDLCHVVARDSTWRVSKSGKPR